MIPLNAINQVVYVIGEQCVFYEDEKKEEN
jgi:hypothetical protein